MHNPFSYTGYGGFKPWADIVPPILKPGALRKRLEHGQAEIALSPNIAR